MQTPGAFGSTCWDGPWYTGKPTDSADLNPPAQGIDTEVVAQEKGLLHWTFVSDKQDAMPNKGTR